MREPSIIALVQVQQRREWEGIRVLPIADPFLDELPQPDRTSLPLVLLFLVLEHLIDFLVDLVGVGQVYIPSEYHVPSAPGTLPGIRPFLLRKARLADDTSAA